MKTPNLGQQMQANSNAIYQMKAKERQMREDNHKNTLALLESSQSLQSLMDGSSTFHAIQSSVEDLAKLAPENHDTLIVASGLIVDEVRFQYPHTIILTGSNQAGYRSSIVAHFSQVAIEVIHIPREEDVEPKEVGFHTL
jgi:hypothetical protein